MRSTALAALLLAATLPSQILTRGPSVWSHDQDSFVVAFQSSAPVSGAVEWGPTPALGRLLAGPVRDDHAFEVAGLEPDRSYYYRVLLGGRPVTGTFRTRTLAAPGRSELSFFVIADIGSGGPAQLRVADVLGRWSWDLGILPGDIIYDAGQTRNFDPQFFIPYADLLPTTPFFPVVGNHDILTWLGLPFYQAFFLPTASSGSERWFSFDAGGVHFVGLDSNLVFLSSQTEWLRADLAAARASGAEWIFVFFHHAPYSSGEHGRDWPVFLLWCPIFEEFEVDAVFTGHDHHYERSRVVRDFYRDRSGVVYFVVGTGGHGIRSVGGRSHSAFATSRFGALKVEVRGPVLRTVFLDGSETDTGQELDSWVSVKGPATPALRARSEHPAPGGAFRYAVDAPAGAVFAVFAALVPGYQRVDGLGLWHLALGQAALIEAGFMGASGTTEFSIAVPPDPAFSGQEFFLQGVSFDPTGRGLVLTGLLESRVK